VTGRSPSFGNSVSHSHRRTRRRWNPNIQRKTYFLPSQGRNITLRGQHQGHQGDRPRRNRSRRCPAAGRRAEDLMASTEIRPVVKLRSTAGTGYTYVTRKNRRNDPDRLVLKKYDPIIRRHVDFREER
jgi:large subunit ribosomal protein L33